MKHEPTLAEQMFAHRCTYGKPDPSCDGEVAIRVSRAGGTCGDPLR